VAALAGCGVVVSLMFTLVVPMLPMFPALLHTTSANASWMATATLLSGAVATPLGGRLGDMYGKRRVLVGSLGLLTFGSVICATSPSLGPLLVGRTLQGAAAGVIPLGISILRDELPPARVGSGIGLISATLGLGAGAGLLLGGFIVEHFHWQTVFWLSATMGALAIGLVLLVVPESPFRTGGRFDALGALGLSVVLLCGLLPISKGHEWGWGDPLTLGLLASVIAVAPLWVWYQARAVKPFVDLRITASRPVLFTNLAAMFLGFAGFANFIATAEIVQLPTSTGYGFGGTLTTVGLCLLPGTAAMLVLSPLSARLSAARSPRFTLAVGALVIAIGYLGRILMSETLWQVVVASLVVSAGTALTYSALPLLIVSNVPTSETAAANGLNALMRAIGTTAASAVFAAVLGAMTSTDGGHGVPSFKAFVVYLGIAGTGALLASVLALAIPRRGQV
jgi:MFS family permease